MRIQNPTYSQTKDPDGHDPDPRDPTKWRHTHLLFEGSARGEPWLDDLGRCLQPHIRPVQREVKRVRRPPAVHYGVPHSHLPEHNLWRQSFFLGPRKRTAFSPSGKKQIFTLWAPPKGLSTPLVTSRLQYITQLNTTSKGKPISNLCLPLFSIHVLYMCIAIIKSSPFSHVVFNTSYCVRSSTTLYFTFMK